jgi:transcriptional regulator with GAF, ATPase, and Fis domain
LTTELLYQQQLYDATQQRELFDHLMQAAPNTEEMQQLLNTISRHLASKTDCIILLQGQAGCGKSTFAKKVAALARSLSHIVLGCASTGLAATVYENFYTAHSLFKIPVIPGTILSLPLLFI